MTLRVPVEPALLVWACERNRRDVESYVARFPALPTWVDGGQEPTLKQLEAFAAATSTPVGYFFLPAPPVEVLPIRDFRTMAGQRERRPSPELLDTIRDCQARQDWYRELMLSIGEAKLGFVGTARVGDDVVATAGRMRAKVGFDVEVRRTMKDLDAAFSQFAERIEDLGVLVMRSGIVGSNTHRKLEPEEFRGFALADDMAPVIFVNGSDAKAAQIFTLAHELAHVWLGQSGVSDEQPDHFDGDDVERWCNAVAAELLVPLADLATAVGTQLRLDLDLPRLARTFNVSRLVILRRLHELGRLDVQAFRTAYRQEVALAGAPVGDGGGDFYRTLPIRVSKRFARAVLASTLEGQTLYRDAFRMLGIKKTATFEGLATNLGVV